MPDRGGHRRFRDASGLNGYLVRAGDCVAVRTSPDDPDRYRVDEIVGDHGRYSIHRGQRPPPPSLGEPFTQLVVALAIGTVYLAHVSWGAIWPAGLAMLGGVQLVRTVQRVRSRRRLTAETNGTVTDVWRGRRSAGGKRDGLRHSCTVHFVTPEGRDVHSRYPYDSCIYRPKRNQSVRVRYDPDHPPDYEVAGDPSRRVRTGAATLVAAGMLGTAALGAAEWLAG